MLGPYTAENDGAIKYKGNKIFEPISDIRGVEYPASEFEKRVEQLSNDPMWGKIAQINHRINMVAQEYFDQKGALFTTVPLTTRMISSPGAVYGKEAISYTSDTCPIKINWFDLPREAFLSESSQIYLELAMLQKGVAQVYAVYNSFRKEHADATHLSEFHHIEYEGKIKQSENEMIALGLIGKIIEELITQNTSDIGFFLNDEDCNELNDVAKRIQNIPKITFRDALDVLYRETKDEQYKQFTMKNFGSWEEIKLTQIFESPILVKEFPLLEVPFYHARIDDSSPAVADNADIIWAGYREIIGSGHRVRSEKELEEKAQVFCLPKEDYLPYLQSRELPEYCESSGFGLGWERFLQGVLKLPFIWSGVQFPRGHNTLRP